MEEGGRGRPVVTNASAAVGGAGRPREIWHAVHACRGTRTGPAPAGKMMRRLAATAACSSGPTPQALLLGKVRDGELGRTVAAGASFMPHPTRPATGVPRTSRPSARLSTLRRGEGVSCRDRTGRGLLFAPMGPRMPRMPQAPPPALPYRPRPPSRLRPSCPCTRPRPRMQLARCAARNGARPAGAPCRLAKDAPCACRRPYAHGRLARAPASGRARSPARMQSNHATRSAAPCILRGRARYYAAPTAGKQTMAAGRAKDATRGL